MGENKGRIKAKIFIKKLKSGKEKPICIVCGNLEEDISS